MDAILYRARLVNGVVRRETERLSREIPDCKTFIVCYQPDYESALHSAPGSVYCYGQRDLHDLPYPQKLSAVDWSDPKLRPPSESDNKKFFRGMEWGHQDLPVMKFFLDHPDFDRYWVIEDDVRCSGPWPDVFAELRPSSADLLMTVVQDHAEAPGWYWWHHLDTGSEMLSLGCRVKGFPPFCRLSKTCLETIDRKYRSGWGGHYEVAWPTIARTSGLLIEDIGGPGTYTPLARRNRLYTYTDGNGTLFPGTFVYRPPFHDTGVSEFAKNVMPHTMLWHPVKSDGGPTADSPGIGEETTNVDVGPVLDLPGRRPDSNLNLALRKPALQSTMSPRFAIGRTEADDAKGGNNGNVSCDYGFHTAAERDPWWQVDLEDSFLLHRVVIFNRVSQAERLKHFTVLGSRNGEDWKVLFRRTDNHVFGQSGEPYTAEIAGEPLARFVRVRLDGNAPLHFRECQVFGVHPDPQVQDRMERRNYIAPGRRGRVVEIEGFAVFIDDENYDRRIIDSLERADYEDTERQLAGRLIRRDDRVIDVGTGLGFVAMTAASITGADGVVTFDGNTEIANDARDNFKRNGLEGIGSHVAILRNRQMITDPHQTMTFHVDKAFWASRLNVSAAAGNIVKTLQVPISCLEDVIESHHATVLICDMEGEEVQLFSHADLSGIRLIIMETHYWIVGEVATDEMVGRLIRDGFSLDLGLSGFLRDVPRRRILVLQRQT